MPAAGEKPVPEPDMYASLGVSKTATSTEIRRAYRNLITKVRGYPSKLTRRPGVSLADGRSFAFSPENARSPRRARLTASAHPDRSIPTRAATPSSLSESSAPTTSSPTRRSARITTPPAKLRGPWRRSSSRRSAGARFEIPEETARVWRRSHSRTPSSRRRNKRYVASVPSARSTPVRVRDLIPVNRRDWSVRVDESGLNSHGLNPPTVRAGIAHVGIRGVDARQG